MEDIDSNGISKKALCSLDKQSGKVQTLQTLTNDQWILDSDGCDVYLKTIDGSQHSISLLDIKTGAVTRELDRWTQSERSGNMLGGKMYYYDFSDNTFVRKDYATGEAAVVDNTTGVSFTICSVYADQVYALYDSASQAATFELGGQIKATTYRTEQLGHESVQDFLNGRSNFVPCETLD